MIGVTRSSGNFKDQKTISNSKNKDSIPQKVLKKSLSPPETKIQNQVLRKNIKKTEGIYVNADWKQIYHDLKGRGYSLQKISNVIGSDFKNQVYKGYQMHLENFKKLTNICSEKFNHEISHRKGVRNSDTMVFEKNKVTAEIIGFMLGDGHLGDYMAIIMNGVDELEIIEYVEKILNEELGINTFRYSPKGKALQIRSGKKAVVRGFLQLGLIKGNKVKNQVSVPNWINDDPQFQRAVVKGLFDSDGSIYLANKKNGTKSIGISFNNHSKQLLDFFQQQCDKHGITGSRTRYTYHIRAKSCVRRYLDFYRSQKTIRFEQKHNIEYFL